MKFLALAVVVVMQASPTKVPRQTANGTPGVRQSENHSSNNQTTAAKPSAAQNDSEPDSNAKANANTPAANTQQPVRISALPPVSVKRDWIDWLSLAFSGTLVGVGLGGTLLALRTLRAVERQAKANEDQLGEIRRSATQTDEMIAHAEQQAESGRVAANAAAESAVAAKRSADVLIKSERAWVMVELSIRSYTGDRRRVGKISKHTTSKGESTSVQLYLRFWNDGGVPAWITDITIRGGLVGELPEIPRDDVDLIYSRIGPEPIGVSAEPVEYELFLQYPGWNDGPGGMGTVFYGLIRYRDVFSSELSTRFAYTLTSGGDLQRLAGFAEYNNNT